MNARQQLARLLPLTVLVLLACVGLRGGITWNGALNGPLRQYGVIIGIALEVILGTLLVITYYRGHLASRGGQPGLPPGDDSGQQDIAGVLRLVLRVLLGAAMTAIAITILVGLHLHLFSGARPQPATLPRRPLQPTRQPHPGAGAGGGELSIPLKPILYALLVIVLLAALVASIYWARRLSRLVVLPTAQPDPDAGASEELRAAVASGRAAMADLDDARAAIIACYEAMESSLAERGAARGVAGTPDELLRQVTGRKIVTGTGALVLTRLFYEARFSSHDLGPEARQAATEALDELAADLRAAQRAETQRAEAQRAGAERAGAATGTAS